MIGRGLIADPFLPSMIKNNTAEYPEDRIERFSKFHDRLFTEFENTLSGEKHVIMKMLSYWKYFATSFSDNASRTDIRRGARGLLLKFKRIYFVHLLPPDFNFH